MKEHLGASGEANLAAIRLKRAASTISPRSILAWVTARSNTAQSIPRGPSARPSIRAAGGPGHRFLAHSARRSSRSRSRCAGRAPLAPVCPPKHRAKRNVRLAARRKASKRLQDRNVCLRAILAAVDGGTPADASPGAMAGGPGGLGGETVGVFRDGGRHRAGRKAAASGLAGSGSHAGSTAAMHSAEDLQTESRDAVHSALRAGPIFAPLARSKDPVRSQDRPEGVCGSTDGLEASREKRARRLAHRSGCPSNQPRGLRYKQLRLHCPGSRHYLGVPTMSMDCGQEALIIAG